MLAKNLFKFAHLCTFKIYDDGGFLYLQKVFYSEKELLTVDEWNDFIQTTEELVPGKWFLVNILTFTGYES